MGFAITTIEVPTAIEQALDAQKWWVSLGAVAVASVSNAV
jgi:hypothetical protein